MKKDTTNKPLSVITENGKKRNATCGDCFHLNKGNSCSTKFGKRAEDTKCHYTPSRYSGPGRHKPTQDAIDMLMDYFEIL